jgi:hypothetical protein
MTRKDHEIKNRELFEKMCTVKTQHEPRNTKKMQSARDVRAAACNNTAKPTRNSALDATKATRRWEGRGGEGVEPKAQHQVQRALLLDVVVGEGAAVLQLLAGEDEALLVGGDTLLVLNFSLDGVDSVGRLHLEGDGLAGERFDEHLHLICRVRKH